MSKNRITPMQWIIRILIVLLFCAALVVGFGRLLEWNELEQQKEELEKQKEELEEQME
jgi:cell division protein FtsB